MASPSSPSYLSVWVPVPKRQSFIYAVPSGWREVPRAGQLVWAPLGRRKVVGLVAGPAAEVPRGVGTIRELIEPFPPECSISPELLQLFRWSQGHYLAPPGEILKTFFPSQLLKGKMDQGKRARSPVPLANFSEERQLSLTPEQAEAVQELHSAWGTFHPVLLQGVTGSGKTEVYLQLCEAVLERGGGALILVPEIALTPQIMGRFASRFGKAVGSYHSGMTDTQRLRAWWGTKEGNLRILIGTRSAVGLPVRGLSLLIVDEEQDSSYKQEDRFRYHARDLAVVRGRIENIPVILGTATPSLETRENVQRNKYHHLRLRERATPGGNLPKIHLVDLKKELPDPETLLSSSLRDKLQEVLERGEQALFFLNRRGYSPFLLCRDCGEVIRCPNCEISLTYHKRPTALKCHYCEYSVPIPDRCPSCREGRLAPMGIGTERLEEGFEKAFPGIRIGRLDRDVATSRLRTEELLSQFEKGDLDVLIGTQLVTKGHDFKRLTLVGILLADVTLNLPDFRAAERAFQIVTQVAGRAGRHDLPGEVFLQTFRPQHYAIVSALSQDPEEFFLQERQFRQSAAYPPFSRLILLRLSGNQLHRVETAAETVASGLRTYFKNFPSVQILGPAPSILEKIRGKFRWQILMKTSKFEGMRRVLEEKIPHLENNLPAGVQLSLDVDPVGIF